MSVVFTPHPPKWGAKLLFQIPTHLYCHCEDPPTGRDEAILPSHPENIQNKSLLPFPDSSSVYHLPTLVFRLPTYFSFFLSLIFTPLRIAIGTPKGGLIIPFTESLITFVLLLLSFVFSLIDLAYLCPLQA